MGTAFTKGFSGCAACGGTLQPFEKADIAFQRLWDRFYSQGEDVSVDVPLGLPWEHRHANTWAKEKCAQIENDMESRQVQSTFNYKVEGTMSSGKATITCQTAEGRTFTFELTYETE